MVKVLKKAGILLCVLVMLGMLIPGYAARADGESGDASAKLQEYLDQKMAPDIAAIKARGTLRIAIPDQDLFAFFEEDEEGNLSGIDIDLARNIADALGVEAEFVRIGGAYSNLTENLKQGNVDVVIATFSHILDRIQYIDFTEPYLSLRFAVMVNKSAMVTAGIDHNPVPYMKENPVDIAVNAGTSHVDVAQMLFPDANIILTDSYEEACRMVADGEAFATLSGELEFYTQYLNHRDLSVYVTTYAFDDVKDEFCVGVSRDCPQLLDFINLYLSTSLPITVEDVEGIYDEKFQQE